MEQPGNSLEQGYSGSSYDSSLESAGSTVITAAPDEIRQDRFTPFKLNKTAFLITGVTLGLIALVVGIAFVVSNTASNKSGSKNSKQPGNYSVSTPELSNLSDNQLQVASAQSLAINGQLKVNETLVLSPTTAPTSPVTGEIYYDQKTNQPYVYTGSEFVSLSGVSSLGGAQGALNLGSSLQVSGNTLSVSSSLLQSVSGSLNSPRVSSLQGLTGKVTLTGGSGIAISGTTISNSGVISLSSIASSLIVNDDGHGNYTIDTTAGGTVVLGPSAAQVDASDYNAIDINKTGVGNLLNLASSGKAVFTVNQTGAVSIGAGHTYQGLLVLSNGANDFTTTLKAAGSGTQSQNLAYTLPVTNSVDGSDTICLYTLKNCAGGTVSSPGGSANKLAVFTADQTIADSSITDVGILVSVAAPLTVTGNLTVTGSGNGLIAASLISNGDLGISAADAHPLTLQGNASSTFIVKSGASTTTLGFDVPTGTNTITFPDASGIVCLQGSTDCGFSGTGSGVASILGTAGGSTAAAGAITLNNAFTDGSTITLQDAVADGVTKGIASFNSTNFTSSGGIINTAQGIGLTAAPQFAGLTLTGDITLSGNVTNNLAYNGSGTNDLQITSSNNNIVFSILGGSQTFTFPTTGGTGQTICTSGISCAAGGGQAVILEPVGGAQLANGANPGIYLNKTSGSANLVQLQTGSTDAFVINSSGTTSITSLQTNSITPTAALTIGDQSKSFTLQGSSASTIVAKTGSFTTTLGFSGTPTGSVSYYFDNDGLGSGSYFICTSNNNCGSGGTGVGATGATAGYLPVFTSASGVTNSAILQDSTSSPTLVTVTTDLGLGVASGSSSNLVFYNGTNNNKVTLKLGAAPSSDVNINLPTAGGTLAVSGTGGITVSAAGVISCSTCLGGGGGSGVASVNSLTGALTIANASTSGGDTITIQNAAADGTTKGIAAFNSTNFTATSGVINTKQNINTTASPQFAGITLGDDTSNLGQLKFTDGTGDSGNNYRSTLKLFGTLSGNQTINVPNISGTLAVAVGSSANLSLTTGGVIDVVASPTFTTVTATSSLKFKANGKTITLQGSGSQANDVSLTIPYDTGASDTICLQTKGNCSGSGITYNGSPSAATGYLPKFDNGTATQVVVSQLYDDGTFVGVNTSTNAAGARLNVQAGSSQVGAYVKGYSGSVVAVLQSGGGSADLLQLKDSLGATKASIDSAGNFSGGSFNSAIISGGNLSGGTVSGGTLTSSAVNGLNVSSTVVSGAAALDIQATGTNALSLGTTGAGTVNIGATSSTTINIGRTTGTLPTVAIQGGTISLTNGNGTNDTAIQFANTQSSGHVIYTFDRSAAAGTYSVCTSSGNCLGGAGGGANTALSNLSSVAINTSLLAGTTNTIDLGSSSKTFKTGYFGTSTISPLLQSADGTTGAALTIRGGNGSAGAGGTIVVQGGQGTSAGGALNIFGGTATAGAGGTITLGGGSGTTSAGSVIVKPQGSDTTTAFQVQRSGGTALLTADTTSTGGITVTASSSTSALIVTPGIGSYSSGANENPGPSVGYSTDFRGDYSGGYSFVPNVSGKVKQLGICNYSGTYTVKLYASSTSTVLASTSITASGNHSSCSWVYANITPVSLVAGTTYTVGMYSGGSTGWLSAGAAALPSNTTNISVISGLFGSGNTMPDQDYGATYGLADITFNADPLLLYPLQVDTQNFAVNVGASATFRNVTNSSEAFTVKNAASQNLVSVGTSNNMIDLFGGITGGISSWSTSSTAMVGTGMKFSAEGYVFSSNASTIYSAKIKANGDIGAWQSAGTNASGAYAGSGAYYNGNFYVGTSNGLYFTQLNSDGTVGTTWTKANTGTNYIQYPLIANGYVYKTTVDGSTYYYAKIAADGTVGTISSASFIYGTLNSHIYLAISNGYAYLIGGSDNSGSGSIRTQSLYAKINSDGTFGTWNYTTYLSNATYGTPVFMNGYVYMLSEKSTFGSPYHTNRVLMAPVNSNGTLGSWTTTTVTPTTRGNIAPVGVNGYIYSLGGVDYGCGCGASTSAIYYGSVSRLRVNANLDLVSLQGVNELNTQSGNYNSSLGGSITAGNITAAGNLEVFGDASFNQSLSVAGRLKVNGSGVFNGSGSFKSSGNDATLGSELISNPNFTSWTGTAWTLASSTATHISGGGVYPLYPGSFPTPTAGAFYRVVFTVSGMTAGDTLYAQIGSANSPMITDNGTYSIAIQATNTGAFYIYPSSNSAMVISAVSVRQILTTSSVLTVQTSTGTSAIEVRSGGNSSESQFIGLLSGQSNNGGIQNTGTGSNALRSNYTGAYNTATGAYSLQANNGNSNTATGAYSLRSNLTGNYNTATGNYSLGSNVSGSNNTANGGFSLYFNSSGTENTALGYNSLYGNTSGSYNTALGRSALTSNQTGTYNAALGYYALAINATGTNNTAIGAYAGYQSSGATQFKTVNNLQNATALGALSQVFASNTLTLGGQGNDNAKVGIGTGITSNQFAAEAFRTSSGSVTTTSGSGAVTGTLTSFTASMVGNTIYIASNNSSVAPYVGTITGYTDATHITVSPVVPGANAGTGQSYYINYVGLQVSTTGNVGIGTNSPGNLLSIGALTTASSSSQVAVSTGGTTNSGIVIQTVASQSSGYFIQAQNSSGTLLAGIDYQGNLTVKAATINGTLTVNGHIVTGNNSGGAGTTSIAGTANVGSTGSCNLLGGSNDTTGTIQIVPAGTGIASGQQCTITFNTAYTATPKVIVSATNADGVGLGVYATASGTSAFTISLVNAPTGNVNFNYFVAQ